jgi:hypothetical protein
LFAGSPASFDAGAHFRERSWERVGETGTGPRQSPFRIAPGSGNRNGSAPEIASSFRFRLRCGNFPDRAGEGPGICSISCCLRADDLGSGGRGALAAMAEDT